jgi:hypothetical protein
LADERPFTPEELAKVSEFVRKSNDPATKSFRESLFPGIIALVALQDGRAGKA